MADVLKVYKGQSVVGQAERSEDGTASVTVEGLEAGTEYPAGTYKVAFSNESGESAKVDVPAFTTKESAPTEPENVEVNTNEDSADVSAQ